MTSVNIAVIFSNNPQFWNNVQMGICAGDYSNIRNNITDIQSIILFYIE